MTLNLKVNRYCYGLHHINIRIIDFSDVGIDTKIFLIAGMQTDKLKVTQNCRDFDFKSQPLLSQFLLYHNCDPRP